MMLNAFALISVFAGSISLVLVAASAVSAFLFYRRMQESRGADERAQARDRLHLSFLMLSTAFILRLASWPLFYMLLQSYIPIVPGAMCIFGVAQVMPRFTLFLQMLKPAAFFLTGGWLILFRYDLTQTGRPLLRTVTRSLGVVACFAGLDAAAELIFVLTFSPPGVAVSCCTVIADLAMPASGLSPAALFGAAYIPVLVAGYYGGNISLIVGIGYLLLRGSPGAVSRAIAASVGAAAILNGLITLSAYREHLGPGMMRLPDHHCLYCLLQYQPLSIASLGLFVLGSFLAVWPLMIVFLCRSAVAAERLDPWIHSLYKGSAICLIMALLLTIVLQ